MNPEYPDSDGCYMARLERTMRDIPDKYHEFLWEVTGEGKSPHVVQAAVTYIESSNTLEGCAEAFGSNKESARQMIHRMIDEGVVSLAKVRENCADNGLQKFGEQRSTGLGEGRYGHEDIRRIREEHGLPKMGFARRLNVSPSAVRAWEKPDSYNPSEPMAERIKNEFES